MPINLLTGGEFEPHYNEFSTLETQLLWATHTPYSNSLKSHPLNTMWAAMTQIDNMLKAKVCPCLQHNFTQAAFGYKSRAI